MICILMGIIILIAGISIGMSAGLWLAAIVAKDERKSVIVRIGDKLYRCTPMANDDPMEIKDMPTDMR